MRVLAPKATREPTPLSFSDTDILSVEGKITRLRALAQHLEAVVFGDKPSAKLVEMYLRTLRELQDYQQLLAKTTEESVDEIIERIATRSRIGVSDVERDDPVGFGEITLGEGRSDTG